MKKIFKLTTVLLFATAASKYYGQTIGMCFGSSTFVTAQNTFNLSNPSYSLNPGGTISSSPVFPIAPNTTTTYTLYVTGTNSNSAVVTTTSGVTVLVTGSPVFTLTSPQNFSLGCGSKSVCTINIVNASTTNSNQVPNGGAVSYTILPPGTPGAVPSGTLSAISSYTANTPGAYTVGVLDNSSFCATWTTVVVTSNTLAPGVSTATISQSPLTCNSPSALVHVSPSSGAQHQWFWGTTSAQSDSVIITTNSAAATPSIATTLTLQISDITNGCSSSTIIPVLQNIYVPLAVISGPSITLCQNTNSVMLTNMSMRSTPPSAFTSTGPVNAILWQGPSPQPTLANSTTYIAHVNGIFTMTAQDSDNGCTNTATFNVVNIGPTAAFTHTVTNGTVGFNNVSSGTATNTAYFWDFGDGSTSTLQNPTHIYASSGAHLVKFKVTNPGMICADSVILAVNVSGIPCVANSGFSLVPTATAQVWNVIPAYPWNVTAATWYWGDGSSTNTLYTSHQYSAAGMYTICLSVTVSCLATSSTCTSYSVYRTSQSGLMVQVNVISPDVISGLNNVTTEENIWQIIPNPNNGEFKLNLKATGTQNTKITIYDLTGRALIERQVAGSSEEITFQDHLPAGLYLITVESGNSRSTRRLVVDR